MRKLVWAYFLAAGLFACSCGSGLDGGEDASVDAGEDAGVDAGEDAGLDAGEDASIDAGEDAGLDAGLDAGEDASLDASTDPVNACVGAGGAGHVKLVAAYWASSAAYGDYLSELAPVLHAGHVDLGRLEEPLPAGVDVIVDLHWQLFDYTTHAIRADIETRLDAIEAGVNPLLNRLVAFYLIDEPYLGGHLIPRGELELAVSTINDRFPGVPTYITFAHHCFDPQSSDAACVVPSSDRGIPAGLDWVGFDWYNSSNDLAVAGTHVATRIITGVNRIEELAPTAKIILVPESYTDGNRLEATVISTLYDYFTLAEQRTSVFGVDFFLWADVPAPQNFLGLSSLPSARAAVRAFSRWVQAGCGEAVDIIPVTQWYASAGPDFRYEPWLWDGRSEGYRVDGVAFALAPVDSPDTVPLMHCLVDRGDSVDSYLTLNAQCDDQVVVSSTVIGGIYPAQIPGTVQLHRYGQSVAPWDHAYALSPNATLPPGYEYNWPIGWVYPPSAL